MMRQHRADVIMRADHEPDVVACCLRSLFEHGGTSLRRLIVIDQHPGDSEMAAMLESVVTSDPRAAVTRHASSLGIIEAYNRGLAKRQGDVVLISSDCVVSADWLVELAAVAHSDERTACVAPLINEGTCSVSAMVGASIATVGASIRKACANLPQWTQLPSVTGPCVYFRADALDAVGLLDTLFASYDAAMDNWVTRVSCLGFGNKRANHAYVHRLSSTARVGHDDAPHSDGAVVSSFQSSDLEHQLERFRNSLDGRLAAHAVRAELTGKLRVALDIRHVPAENVGTRTYTVSLAQALGEQPGIELTLLVSDPAQARGLPGRVVRADDWSDDVAVIHKPAQVIDPRELRLLFRSSAHVVISYLDLIGYRIPHSFPTNAEFDLYRATSNLSLHAAQRIIAISACAADEIHAEFGIPRGEIDISHLGVDANWFGQRADGPIKESWRRGLTDAYFLSIATDFPHKNLSNLLDAYAMLRGGWLEGKPPALVLVGHTSSSRTEFYSKLESSELLAGVTFLGPVSRERLRSLYQYALALVFPSLYEGFGLPPLEAMAAGTPVVAMPISAVPEVAGDAVLYADGLSISALARAMESVGIDQGLRDDLVARGKRRVEAFRWEQTARATVEAYRSAVFRPSNRSLQMRRQLEEAINLLSEPRATAAWLESREDWELVNAAHPLGIRNALKALNASLQARLRREIKRLQSASGRRIA
jgi:glycosyltransferase involved in cell wall biosynthesis